MTKTCGFFICLKSMAKKEKTCVDYYVREKQTNTERKSEMKVRDKTQDVIFTVETEAGIVWRVGCPRKLIGICLKCCVTDPDRSHPLIVTDFMTGNKYVKSSFSQETIDLFLRMVGKHSEEFQVPA